MTTYEQTTISGVLVQCTIVLRMGNFGFCYKFGTFTLFSNYDYLG